MSKDYYRLSLVHTFAKSNNVLVWWRPNCCNYAYRIDQSGLYEYSEDDSYKSIHKDVVDKLKTRCTYGQFILNHVVVVNDGVNRKALGIKADDLNQLDVGSGYVHRDDYGVMPKDDSVTESYRYVKSKTTWIVKAKYTIDESWCYIETCKADTRDKAISHIYSNTDWGIADCSYIEFKAKVSVRRAVIKQFDKWVKESKW